ncbi:MAG: radical SAM protein [archaeon]
MKILFINPATKKDRVARDGKIKGSDIFRYPKLGLLSVAALTDKSIDIEFCDETIEKINYNTDADLIAISSVTALAPRSYKLAKKFRDLGKTIVMGGMHATFLPDECLKHVDSVVIGQAEGSWERLLKDYQKGNLKKNYSSNISTELKIPFARRDPEQKKGYAKGHVFGISRGCSYRCEFCSVTHFFKGKYYKRPIEDVVQELKTLPHKIINITDDNLFCDPSYSKELFKALIPLKKHLLFQASVNITNDIELMQLIKRAGGKGVFIGIESLDSSNIRDVSKFQNNVKKYHEVIKTFHDHGMVVEAGMMFGFDNDTNRVFKNVYDFAMDSKLDLMQVGIVTPMPGTKLHDRMIKEGRIIDGNWANYDCKHVVFKTKNITKKQLEDGTNWLRSKFYSYPSIITRGVANFSSLGIIGILGYFLRGNLGFRKNYKSGLDYPP